MSDIVLTGKDQDVPPKDPNKVWGWTDPEKAFWTLGPVTAGFLAMMAVFFGWLPSPMLTALQDTKTLLTTQQSILLNIDKQFTHHILEAERQQRMLLKGLQRLCRNTARTQQHNDGCDNLDY